jgi:hypothetical protein
MTPLTLLLAQTTALPDTIVTRIVPPAESWFAQVTDVAAGVLTILAVLLFVGAMWAALRLRASFDRTQVTLEGVGRDLRTLVDRANGVAQNATAIAEALRADLQDVRETVEFANRRARHAVSVMADRVDEFNAALATMQRDTQGIVVTALTAFRGLRAGMAALRGRGRQRPQPAEMVFVEDEDIENDIPERPRLRRRARGKR